MTAYPGADVVVEAAHDLGEGPQWDARTGRLSWVDITAGQVHALESTGARRRYDIGQHVGAALPAADGGWLLATRGGFARLSEDGTIDPVLDVVADAGIRFNDAKADPRGRAFGGTMAYDNAPGRGALYRLDPGPTATVVRGGLTISNGLDWSAAGDVFWFIDSGTQSVRSFDYDIATGAVGDELSRIEVDTAVGMPDGLCVDAEGGVWVAMWGGSAVHGYGPDGRLTTIVELPVSQPTSCVFGGPDLDVLYITSAAYRLGARAESEPLAGSVFSARVGVSGRPATPWKEV